MNVGFHIPRDNHLKFFASTIDYFSSKGWHVSIFCDYRKNPSELGYKSYQFPAVEKIPEFGSGVDILSFRDVDELAGLIQARKIGVVFFVNFDPLCKALKSTLNKKNYSFVAAELHYLFELFLTGTDLSYTDVIYILSDNWKSWWKEFIDHQAPRDSMEKDGFIREIDKKCVAVGFPEADQCKTFDRRSIRIKYGIPEDKKVILFFPFPWRIPFDPWTHIVYRPQPFILKFARLLFHRALHYLPDVREGLDDLRLTESIRRFADRNNALFLVKGRLKNKVPRYLRRTADRVFFDEGYYPFITLELLFIADLSISFYSASIMESVLAKTPALCIAPKGGGYWPGYDDRHHLPAFSSRPGSFYHYEGAVYYEPVDHFIKTFQHKALEDFRLHREKAREFTSKYLGFNDHNASGRIHADLLRRLEERE